MIIDFKRKPRPRGSTTTRRLSIDDIGTEVDPAELAAMEAADEIKLEQQEQRRQARARGETPARARQLQPLSDPYVRVPLQWLVSPCRDHVFAPEARLFLLLLYRSHWGQRGVKLTDAVAAEVGIPGKTKRDALRRLERKGWVRVERQERLEAPVVWPLLET
jgi:hypothetical protein